MNWIKKLLGGKDREPQQVTVATVQKEAANLYVLRITGVLKKATLDRIQAIGARDFERGVQDLKILMVLTDFKGWKQGDDWNDLDFFARYEQNIAKIAVVSVARWEAETLMFLGAGHRKGEVRYFGPAEESKARAWLLE